MENASFEQALEVVKTLPTADKRRLQQWLAADEHMQPSANGEIKLAYPREREMRWLSQHEAEYAGQWLALDGDRLVSHGTDPRKVFAEAQAQGVADPFMAFAESDEPAMGGW
jgi:hypothetical protein